MGLELKDLNPVPDAPRAKQIILSGEIIGDVKPSIYADRLSWHAGISLKDPRMLCSFLIQGHGASPRTAIANAIISGRRDRDAMTERLAWLEKELGTTAMNDADLARDII